jgi:hypothetical protein
LIQGNAKLLICGGYHPDIDTCEVINLGSSVMTCKKPPNFPATIFGSIGGLDFKNKPIICGGIQNGDFSNRCYSLNNNVWVSTVSMNSARRNAAAVQLQDGRILVTGGNNGAYLKSAEMLTEQGWDSKIPSLPVTIAVHCVVAVNSTTVMVIGGYQNNRVSGRTFYFTFGEETWTDGPELKYKRIEHSCGRVLRNKDSQEMSIIVASGDDGESPLSSVEILDEQSNEWLTGITKIV